MAKSNTRRKKKPVNGIHQAARMARAAMSYVENSLTISTSSASRTLTVNGLDLLPGRVPPKMVRTVKNQLITIFRTEPRRWHMWLAVFHKDGENEWVDSDIITFDSAVAVDLDSWTRPAMVKYIGENDTDGTGVGWAWMLTPSNQIDMENIHSDNINYFRKQDIFNNDKRKDKLLMDILESPVVGE